MSISRRELLRGFGGLAAYACWPVAASGCADENQRDQASELRGEQPAFLHGVASGDPLPDGIVLWTRVTPAGEEPLEVEWQLCGLRG
jgi:alkaline phosphatase D